MTKNSGLFITFEGIDGAGKTTQVQHLTDFLRSHGVEPIVTREPGGTILAEQLRQIVVAARPGPEMLPLTEALIMSAARAEHVDKVILPALHQGRVVVCDRFIDSTVAYQGYGLGVDLTFIQRLNELSSPGCTPDLTFVLDLPVDAAVERSRAKSVDRIEGRQRDFHQRVRHGFLTTAAHEPARVMVIEADDAETAIARQIATTVVDLFGRRFDR